MRAPVRTSAAANDASYRMARQFGRFSEEQIQRALRQRFGLLEMPKTVPNRILLRVGCKDTLQWTPPLQHLLPTKNGAPGGACKFGNG